MVEDPRDGGDRLTRHQASAAVTGLGWRYLRRELRTCVPVASLAQAVELAARSVVASGPAADGHLRLDIRPDAVMFSLQSQAVQDVTVRDIELAGRISVLVAGLGLATGPAAVRSVQLVEIAIDALDIPAVRLFWKAVLGYADELDAGPAAGLVDPLGQGPAVWFQQQDAPRPQRNRIHLDISVPHDEAAERIRAALAAGGTLVSEVSAPAFWVLADAEGNEACVTTWQGRD